MRAKRMSDTRLLLMLTALLANSACTANKPPPRCGAPFSPVVIRPIKPYPPNTSLPNRATLEVAADVGAHNLDNVNTPGFKRAVLTADVAGTERPSDSNTQTTLRLDMSPGRLDPTDRPLDLAIDGLGFFQIEIELDGETTVAYTRAGDFSIDEHGNIVAKHVTPGTLLPQIRIPQGFSSITVARDGEVSVRLVGSPRMRRVGQIELARFAHPQHVVSIQRVLYLETNASGPPTTGHPYDTNFGAVLSGVLEQSNVERWSEYVALMRTQRALWSR